MSAKQHKKKLEVFTRRAIGLSRKRARSKLKILKSEKYVPGLANVQDVDTVGTGLPEVVLHVNLEVLAAEVALRSQEHLDVLAGGVEDGGQVGGSHLDDSFFLVCLTKKGEKWKVGWRKGRGEDGEVSCKSQKKVRE